MKHRLIYRLPILEVLDDDALEQGGSNSRIPNTFGINDDDRTFGAHTKARRLSTFDALRPEKEVLSLKKLREQRIDLSSAPIRRAEVSGTHEDVT
jgi:hypothetical protein